ncbi:MAG: J domain-containing protein [Novosphingobium sp.]
MSERTKHDKFHGRIGGNRPCDRPGCEDRGEFRAPGLRPPGSDGPGSYRWFCLDHVREFNSGYDWFEGMSADEILAAQSPLAGWERETRAFRPDAGVADTPRWHEYADPLEAIAARSRHRVSNYARAADAVRRGINPDDRRAYDALGLAFDCDRKALRARYSELVRRYHPDRNGGDRGHEAQLQAVVAAYQRLRGRPQFG